MTRSAVACWLLALASVTARAEDHAAAAALDFTRAPKETLAWGELARVGVTRTDHGLARRFLPGIRALAGKRIVLYGYATPIDASTEPARIFLLSSQPIACAGCEIAVEPEGVVEVRLARGVALHRLIRRSPAMAVRGTLVLVDDERDVLYRLVDSAIVPAPGTSTAAAARGRSR